MKKKKTRVFTKINTQNGQMAHFSPDTDKVSLDIQKNILKIIKQEKLMPEIIIEEHEFLIEQEIRIINMFQEWQDIINFFLNTNIDNQPKYNASMKAIGDKMIPLRNEAKQLLLEWVDLKVE